MIGRRRSINWYTHDGKAMALFGVIVCLSTVAALTLYGVRAAALVSHGSFFSDFAAQWSFGRFAAAGRGAEIYDSAALHRFQVAQTGVEHDYPFPYPPFYLLLLWPLGLVRSFTAAYLLWIGVTFGLYAWASCGRGQRGLVLLLLIAPGSAVSVFTGQNGFLFAALLIGGFRHAVTRPVLSGILFGLLAFKPQLGLLVPVALLAAGLWRPVVVAVVTITALAVVSSVAFGTAIWLQWLNALLSHGATVEADLRVQPYMPTVTVDLLRLGVGSVTAHAAQLCIAMAVAGLVWRRCRSGVAGFPPPPGVALVEVGSFLATPYAFYYDMPMVTNAVLWFVADKYRKSASLGVGEIAVLTATFALPLLLPMWETRIPYGAPILMLCFALLYRSASPAPTR